MREEWGGRGAAWQLGTKYVQDPLVRRERACGDRCPGRGECLSGSCPSTLQRVLDFALTNLFSDQAATPLLGSLSLILHVPDLPPELLFPLTTLAAFLTTV